MKQLLLREHFQFLPIHHRLKIKLGVTDKTNPWNYKLFAFPVIHIVRHVLVILKLNAILANQAIFCTSKNAYKHALMELMKMI